jgi:hypothetical protein
MLSLSNQQRLFLIETDQIYRAYLETQNEATQHR